MEPGIPETINTNVLVLGSSERKLESEKGSPSESRRFFEEAKR
jgi:hypothetical protein